MPNNNNKTVYFSELIYYFSYIYLYIFREREREENDP